MIEPSDKLAKDRLFVFLSHFLAGVVRTSEGGTPGKWSREMGLADIGTAGNTLFLTFVDDEGVNRRFRVELHPTDPEVELNPADVQQLKERWKREVVQREKDVDPDQIFDWEGILLGFLLGAGMPQGQAIQISQDAPSNGWPI